MQASLQGAGLRSAPSRKIKVVQAAANPPAEERGGLVLTRYSSRQRRGEDAIEITLPGGSKITVRVLDIRGATCRVMIQAPRSFRVMRSELVEHDNGEHEAGSIDAECLAAKEALIESHVGNDSGDGDSVSDTAPPAESLDAIFGESIGQ